MKDLADYAKAQKTTGLIVVKDGRTLIEENWPLSPGSEQFATLFARGTTSTGALREDVASQQKSLIALLAGIAIDRGLLDIALPVASFIGEGWTKALPDQERAITVRHLLEMTSGLKESLEVEAPAGTKFFYNTPVYARLQRVLEVASGQKLDALTRDWLTGPLGMADTEWRPRPAAFAQASGNAWGLETAPRDLVKLGELILGRGKGLISETQLDAVFKPTATNPAYGRLWWLNNGEWWIDVTSIRHDGQSVPGAPADLVQGLGAQGRILGVVPSRKLIVVRLGQQPPDADFRTQFWHRVMAALRAAAPRSARR
ncbi:MAG: serine hydrolase [Alphaproteobacteria bacterium]|nr:serine hydrolase [Alphaproteobacteria bacterium]